MGALLKLEQAQALVLARATPLGVEQVALAAASGRVTADAALARVDLPPFASSAMDGYAVRSSDLPGTLRVLGESAAGRPADVTVSRGGAIAISTGAVVPDGADVVVPVEYVVHCDNEIEVAAALETGTNVRPRGGDVAAGDVVVAAGTRLRAAAIGALGAAGVGTVVCSRRPRVAILATGSELVRPGADLRPGQIYESNSVMLAAALASVGADIELLPLVADEEQSHREALERGLRANALVTSGGVSVGPHDLVRAIAAELGVEEVFWRVAIKPGKPVSFGVHGSTLVFGLPGNPVSALVGAELFVKPALRALQGLRDPLPRLESGVLGAELRRNDARDDFVRARARPDRARTLLEPLSGQESHMIVRAAAANALVHVPRGTGVLAAGESVGWIRLAD